MTPPGRAGHRRLGGPGRSLSRYARQDLTSFRCRHFRPAAVRGSPPRSAADARPSSPVPRRAAFRAAPGAAGLGPHRSSRPARRSGRARDRRRLRPRLPGSRRRALEPVWPAGPAVTSIHDPREPTRPRGSDCRHTPLYDRCTAPTGSVSAGGGPRGVRTHNPRIKSPLLCQLELEARQLLDQPIQRTTRSRFRASLLPAEARRVHPLVGRLRGRRVEHRRPVGARRRPCREPRAVTHNAPATSHPAATKSTRFGTTHTTAIARIHNGSGSATTAIEAAEATTLPTSRRHRHMSRDSQRRVCQQDRHHALAPRTAQHSG
jgi:hypothetical protein